MNAMYRDLGLLLLRVGCGGLMLVGHGWAKLMNFSRLTQTFPDPIGIGSSATAALAVFSEVFCAFAVMIGLFTRFSAIPLCATMAVAGVIVHANDPFSKKELSLLFFSGFGSLILMGGGRFAADTLLEKLQLKRRAS